MSERIKKNRNASKLNRVCESHSTHFLHHHLPSCVRRKGQLDLRLHQSDSAPLHHDHEPEMMSSHLRHRIWSQPLVHLRRPYPIPSLAESEISQCASAQARLARPPLLKAPASRGFTSGGIHDSKVSSATRSASRSTTPRPKNLQRISYTAKPASRSISALAKQAWRGGVYSKSRVWQEENGRRNKSSASSDKNGQPPAKHHDHASPVSSEAKKVDPSLPDSSESNNKFHLPHLPKMPHRPTKEELLAAATGFWSRLTVRFKWFSIRSVRPWNVDDWSAFVSWFVLGNIVWVLVGTTTFFSLVILSINTVVAQGMFAIIEV